jgi:predicted regulator of Ras-like GTPase activity (Roadblock/LC7/MglB family)
MTATLLGLGTRAANELGRGTLQEVLIRGQEGYACMMDAGSGTLLLAMATRDAKLGLLFLDMRRSVEDIRRVL